MKQTLTKFDKIFWWTLSIAGLMLILDVLLNGDAQNDNETTDVNTVFIDCYEIDSNEPNDLEDLNENLGIDIYLDGDDVDTDFTISENIGLDIYLDDDVDTDFTISYAEKWTDLSIDYFGDKAEISYDPNTNTLTSNRTAEDTIRLIYCCLRYSIIDFNEPVNVVFEERKHE